MAKEIQQLTPGVVKKLRSGIAFMNVAHCVEELVLNSIDAEANCIAVNLNLPVYQIQVIDNGCGISAEQMNVIGTRYATSKCHTLEDLQNLKCGGFRGEALSSLKEISSALMIESRIASSEDTYCKIFTQGKALEPKKSLNSRPSKGTTVTVYDFMYNLPVRKKSICEALDVEECRKLLQSIALMYPNISFTLQNEGTGEMCLQLRKCSSLYNSFLQMFGQSKASNLKTIDYQTDIYEISGCISTECHISKDLQFLYVNKRHVLRTKLHKLINRILNKALSSKQKLNINSSSSASESSSPLKNQCHCIFVINISCPYDKYDIIFEPRKTIIEFSDWDSLLKVVEEALIDFLKREKLYSDVNETELNASNSKAQGNVLPTFDVQDFQQGLFSNVARRLKLLKSNDLHANGIRSENLDKNSHEASITEATSKCHNENESMLCNELRSPVSGKNIETSDQEISMNLKKTKSNTSLLSNSLGGVDEKTSKLTREFVTSSLPQTDFDIPCRSVFPSENPVMLRVPSKSALSNFQTSNNNNNLKFLQMQEKIQCFVRKGNSSSLNKNKPQQKHHKVLSHSAETSSNKSAQMSPVLCIDEKKYETKLKNMINKSAQCPSVSNVNSDNIINKNVLNNIFSTKETKDKSLQCPSVTSKNPTRVQSRFQFKEESHALLQNLKKCKRVQKNNLRKPHTEVNIVSDDNFTQFIDDNDEHKSKKFKSAHFFENFEISAASEINEKRIPEDFAVNIETGTGSEIYKNNHSAVYVPDDIELVSDSPKKFQNPYFYNKKSLDFNKFKSLFGLKTFAKVQKSKYPTDNISIFNEIGKSFQNEKVIYQSEGNFDHCTSEDEVNSYQDLFPDTITDDSFNTPKETSKRCYLTDLSSNFKENTGPFLTEKIHMECETLNENNTVDDIHLNLSEISPSSSVVSRVVHSLISNVVKVNDLPCSPNAFVYNKNDESNDVNQRIPEYLNFQKEIITNHIIPSNKTVELHSNDNSDALSIFGMKSISDNLMADAATKEHSLFAIRPEGPNPSFLDGNIVSSPVLSVSDINFESDPFTQKLPTTFREPLNIKLNKSCSNINSETSSQFKEGSCDNFELDCFTEKLLAASGNDISKAPCTSLVNSHANRSMPNLNISSVDDIELESYPFSEKLSAMRDNNSVRLPCTKLSSSDTKNETSTSQMISVDGIELQSDSLTNNHPTVPDNNSPMPSEIKLCETFSDKNHATSSDFEIKSTAEIEFDSDVLNKKLSTMSGNPSLGKQYSEDLNKNVPNTSSIELFSELSSSDNNPKVSTKEHASETSVISSSIKDKDCIPTSTDSHETDNLEIVSKASTEKDFTTYDHLKLHSQPECKRKIYVDSITGNSSYIAPEQSETQQNKVTDVNNGFLKKSHFFLTHDYSPFVLKTQTPDKFKNDNCNVQSDLMEYVKNNEKHGHCDKWRKNQEGLHCNEDIENMSTAWDNPAFDVPYEVSSIGDDKITQSISQMHVFLNSYKFSKTTLNSMQVIGQVDCKFIACILKDFNENCREQRLLALFDQHAVHERVRLEELIKDLYKLDADGEKYVKTSAVNPLLEISFSDEEIRLLQVYREKLHKIGIHLKIDCNSSVLRVLSVPSCLTHKESGELRRSVSDTVTILQNSIAEWLLSVVKTRSIPQVLPKTLSSVLNYQACRSAVKFGDPLSFEQCCDLMKSLSSCKLPFQCAHGRPSIAPILDLKKIEALYKKKPPPQLQVLLRSLKNS